MFAFVFEMVAMSFIVEHKENLPDLDAMAPFPNQIVRTKQTKAADTSGSFEYAIV